MADLTREGAQARAELLTVESYDVSLDFTRGDTVFGSISEVRFASSRIGADTFVNLVAERVHEATLNGEPVDLSAHVDGRLPLRNLAADNVLAVRADFGYTHESRGVHRSVDQADGKVYLFTEFFPAESNRVFASFDQPDLKAAMTFAVTAPDHWLVLSNSLTPEPTPVREGVARWQFPPTPRLSTYVGAIVAGEYAYVQRSFTTKRGQVIPLGVGCRASLAEYLEADEMIEIAGLGLDFYTDLFDMDFPFTKYDQIFVPEFFAGAMENVACVTFTEGYLFRSKPTVAMYERRAQTVLHELAHMWFGNLVTMRWWGDLWLNESFADFCGIFVTTEVTKYTDLWVLYSGQRKNWGYGQDRLPSTHPVVADAPTLAVAVANFDGISYAKGGSVLKQLMAHVGRQEFFAGVRAYFAEHAWGNAEFADLLRALEAASGKDLREWAAAWLETAGPNTLRAEFEVDDTGRFTGFAVRQQAPADFPTLRPHHIAVGFYDLVDGALTRTHRLEIDVAGELTRVPELVGRPRPDVVLLNDDDLGYTLTRFDPQSLDVLADNIGVLSQPLSRAVAWTAVFDMVEEAELSIPAFVRMLTGALRVETSIELVHTLQRVAQDVVGRFSAPDRLKSDLAEVAAVAAEKLPTAEPGGDFQLSRAHSLSHTAAAPDQLDLAEGLLDGTIEFPGLVVGTEMRWELLHRLVVTGRLGEDRIEAELARDTTDAGIRQAQAARAALPDADHKAAAWALLTESEELGPQGIRAVSAGFAEPEHAALLAPYTARYFEILPALWRTRSERVRLMLADELFPYYGAPEDVLRRAEVILADPDLDPVLRRVLVEATDATTRVLRSRAL